ncbi:MAG: cyclic nucleotide-binding domain-containing protein [Planctomycetaceae bacterium]|nr:cyclic nucleotide-binding domain-containing protein [Planctomycetales bacterium]MCB9872855.1 cyclic nucleotide-binding domain-containing protein [Planctomycetaceae bacterium]MCB9941396.1 cyclic nucleotide-binding domain-containing protein [Planctomycetaceae bacterium]HRX78849.1 cyclic nucleotide-binding and patatin-like phospholipase domain-containing protein [Pirellulaceae bacterium]
MPSPDSAPSPQELLRLIADDPLLSTIDREYLEGLQDELGWVALAEGETLFLEGDTVDAFYFVSTGLLEVTKDQEDLDGNPDNDRLVLAEIGPGATIGEMQILTGGVRSATVTAAKPSGLVKFPKEAFDSFLAKDPNVVEQLAKTIMPRLYRDQMVDVLPNLFGELNEKMLRDLEDKMTWRSLRRGDLLCYQSEPSDSFYIIISGRMQVLIQDASGRSQNVSELSQGESVGEMGVVTGEPRSATIIASRDTELMEFSRDEFEDFTQRYPEMMRRITRMLINRLQRANRHSRARTLSSNILLAPASDRVQLDEFSSQLYEALHAMDFDDKSGMQACLMLTSQEVDKRLGRPGISQAGERRPDDLRLRSWLSEQEKKYAVILLQADPTITNWTSRCIRNADEIMYVANATCEPTTTEVVGEIQLQEAKHAERRHTLVLLHGDVERPQGTLRWLEKLDLAKNLLSKSGRGRHFHIRRRRESDYQRLARYVSRREVGLVLSGGGARGFAHVGCIRAMHELGIPIDMIGGVSMGSLVSAAYAYDPARFEETINRVQSQLKGVLFDVTAPVVAIARGQKFDKRLRSWFGAETQIEDLWMPYFCVSSNLTEAQIVVHEAGPLWWSVRASGTLPGLTSPVVHEEHLLFDGCLLDNLPMDVMRERLGTATVIAVDVVPPHDLKFQFPNVQSPSGWWLLWRKLNPFMETIALPNIVSILHRAGELGSVYGRQKLIDQRIADRYIQPPVDHIKIADFGGVAEARQIGYEFCKSKLKSWWPLHNAAKCASRL